ncbi:T9SS type A sorting domain-containing protein [Fulvivirga sp. M361]|uniref:T9SS type A sorting domain-containing protein n=1 Tax=Fulvivirga sp. M361 TaxID=2594266 RepID=UPI00117B772C|nr:T9SS type A sorting domain-containing protein [Fulvivirga sp. M361]TRX61697.1 T9SS type A sorting domain-containing protein [Fulvivirga sp. M361]
MRTVLIIGCILLPGLLMAQLKVSPVVKQTTPQRTSKSARTQSTAPVQLPFWDDFSFSRDVPSDTLWQDSQNVRINPDIGLNPPSINVASFDGLDVNGKGYSSNPSAEGPTDVLTSCPIDLSALTVDDNVYLSFFYQFAGLGEVSEEGQGDSLVVEFYRQSVDTTWVQVWPSSSSTINRSGAFIQEILRLDDPDFFKGNFQFRIRSFGRQSGLWDNWNIDYVYMNKNRTPNDIFYPDRTISSGLTSIFNTYTAIPKEHFEPSSLSNPTLSMFNLDRIGIGQQQVISYETETDVINFVAEDTITNSSFLDVPEPTESPSIPNQFKEIDVNVPFANNDFLVDADSIYVDFRFILNSDDMDSISIPESPAEPIPEYQPEVYRPINFRSNDTVRTRYTLSDYYAYDDGTAEFGAGFKQSASLVAYQFDLPNGVQDSITALDLYFPFINTDPAGRSIDIIVWADNNGEPGNRILQERVFIITGTKINQYQRYPFRNSALLSGRFYVGYLQNVDTDLRIGLDRNTNTIDRIFENTKGFWESETDLETGSLMIRPVFGVPDTSEITSVDDPFTKTTIKYYPNPTDGKVYMNTRIETIRIFDIHAREINFEKTLVDQTTEIDLLNAPDGIYFMQIWVESEYRSIKIIKN